MGSLGWPEILLIFIVALLIFGPRKLPQLGKSLGRAMGEFRRATNELKSSLEAEVSREEEKLHGDRRRQIEEAYSRRGERGEEGRTAESGAATGAATESAPAGSLGEGSGLAVAPAVGVAAAAAERLPESAPAEAAGGEGEVETGAGPPAAAGEDARPLEIGGPSEAQGDLFAPPGAPAAGSDLLPFGEGEEGARRSEPPGDEDKTSLP